MENKSNESRLLGMLGIAAKARALVFGADMICDALRRGQKSSDAVALVIEASDTSENTHKRLTDRCAYYNTRLLRLQTDMDTLGHITGKGRPVAALGVTNQSMVGALLAKLNESPPGVDAGAAGNKQR